MFPKIAGKHFSTLCLLAMLISAQSTLSAATSPHNFSIMTGYFQQPTSQYYHSYYGASYEYHRPKSSWALRMSYVERPEFNQLGYKDKESAVNLLLGTEVYKKTRYSLRAYAGPGLFQGYIKPSGDHPFSEYEKKSSYQLKGLHTAMDAQAVFGSLFFAIGHEMFVGYVNQHQLNAYVAWPVLFFNLRTGVYF